MILGLENDAMVLLEQVTMGYLIITVKQLVSRPRKNAGLVK